MKIQVEHLGIGAKVETGLENCCSTMSKVIENGIVADNGDDKFSEDFKHYNLIRYDDHHLPVEYFPLEFCPFCGKRIIIEFIDGQTPQD